MYDTNSVHTSDRLFSDRPTLYYCADPLCHWFGHRSLGRIYSSKVRLRHPIGRYSGPDGWQTTGGHSHNHSDSGTPDPTVADASDSDQRLVDNNRCPISDAQPTKAAENCSPIHRNVYRNVYQTIHTDIYLESQHWFSVVFGGHHTIGARIRLHWPLAADSLAVGHRRHDSGLGTQLFETS